MKTAFAAFFLAIVVGLSGGFAFAMGLALASMLLNR